VTYSETEGVTGWESSTADLTKIMNLQAFCWG